MPNAPLRFIISGGGTGGHIFPAVAIANELRRRLPNAEILFVGANGRMEMTRVPEAGYNIVGLDITGLQRRLTPQNLLFPVRVFRAVRKAGKLPFDTITEEYSLEYGKASIQIHSDAITQGARVLLMDDLIATGGTMLAAVRLLERLGASAILPAAIIDLPALGGSKALVAKGFRPFTLCAFDGH